MLVQQLKERILIGRIYHICDNQSQNSVFQPSEKLYHGGPNSRSLDTKQSS